MHLSNFLSSSLLLAAAVLAAEVPGQASGAASGAAPAGQVKVHVVQVGPNGTLAFQPNNLQVNPGEMVQFQFYPKNHSVVQSSFNSPCTPIDSATTNINAVTSNVTGFKSGFMPVSATATTIPVFTMLVNDTTPLWVHCSQTGHCQKGMVLAINAPTTGNKTFAAYQALAMQQSSSSSSSNSTSGSGSTGSGSGTSPSTEGTTSAPATVNAGAKPVINAAILTVLSVFGFVFVTL